MADQQAIVRTAKGLFSQFNRLEAPPGAFLQADNCVIDRPGIVEKRRGFDRYGDALSNVASAMLKFQKRLIVLDGSTLKYDSDGAGTWSSYTGSFSAPDGIRMQGVEAQQSFYFTTQNGPYKLDAITGTPTRAGVPCGLDLTVTKSGTGDGWFSPDTALAYRIVFGRTDDNSQEAIGEPSIPVTLTNTKSTGLSWSRSGGGPYTVTVTHPAHGYTTSDTIEIEDEGVGGVIDGLQTINVSNPTTYTFSVSSDPGASGTLTAGKYHAVDLEVTIPQGIVPGDWCEVYRTALSASAATDPGDRCRYVDRITVTVGHIAAGYLTYQDTIEDLGEDLYTNPLKETTGKSNAKPPYCKCLTQWKGHVWYANTRQPHYFEFRLKTVSGLVADTDTLTVGGTTWTFSTAEDVEDRKFILYTTSPSLAVNIRETCKSFCKVFNRYHLDYQARYMSWGNLEPGIIRIERVSYADTVFYTLGSTNVGSVTEPSLPTSGTTRASRADAEKNGLFHSKFEKPEAVPLSNVDRPGSANSEILGLIPLPDALLIAKEDGYYSITGDSDGYSGASFTMTQRDPTLRLIAPDTVGTLDNAAYAFVSQGVVRSTESGSKIMSWPIEVELNRIAQLEDFSTITHAICYESGRKYLLCTQEKQGDTEVKVVWVYNYVTESWTRWRKPVTCGIVLEQESGGDRLYLAHGVDHYILQERKSYLASDEDFSDETIPVVVTATGTTTDSEGDTVTTATVTYTYHENLGTGWLFEQGTVEGWVTAVSLQAGTSYLLTLDRSITVTAGSANLTMPVKMEVQWMPEALGNAGTVKKFSEGQVYFERSGGTHQMGFGSDTQVGAAWTLPIEIPRAQGWGKTRWGRGPWGDTQPSPSDPIRAIVSRDHQRCRALRVHYLNHYAKEKVSILQMTLSCRSYGGRTQRDPR